MAAVPGGPRGDRFPPRRPDPPHRPPRGPRLAPRRRPRHCLIFRPRWKMTHAWANKPTHATPPPTHQLAQTRAHRHSFNTHLLKLPPFLYEQVRIRTHFLGFQVSWPVCVFYPKYAFFRLADVLATTPTRDSLVRHHSTAFVSFTLRVVCTLAHGTHQKL